MQQTLRSKGYYRGEVDASSVSEPERAFEEFRTLRIFQSQGSLIRRRPENSDSAQRVAKRLTARLRKANLLAGIKPAKGAKRKRNAPDALVVRDDEQN
jgi:hypothetical protein